MEKEQYRSVIHFLFMEGNTCDEIKAKLDAVYRDISPSMTTVKYWFNEFKQNHTSVFDEKHLGCQAEVFIVEIIKKGHEIILADH